MILLNMVNDNHFPHLNIEISKKILPGINYKTFRKYTHSLTLTFIDIDITQF